MERDHRLLRQITIGEKESVKEISAIAYLYEPTHIKKLGIADFSVSFAFNGIAKYPSKMLKTFWW